MLAASRTERFILEDFPIPPELGVGIGHVLIESEFWDHPTFQYSLLLAQTRTTVNSAGNEISRDVERWEFEGLTTENQVPTRHVKEIWARAYLPKMSDGTSLVKVEEIRETYRLASIWLSGPVEKRVERGCVVIFDLAPKTYAPAEVADKLQAQGRRVPAEPTNKLPDSARPWNQATRSSAIVREEDANQVAVWVDTVEVDQEIVKDDFLRTLRWRWHYEAFSGVVEASGPEEERKDVKFAYPLELEAPKLRARPAGAAGIILEARGGGGILVQVWPRPSRENVSPKSYVFFRKVISLPPPIENPDPFSLYDGATEIPVFLRRTGDAIEADVALPGRASAAPFAQLDDTGVHDYAGAPADPLPPAEGISEPETPEIPDADAWENIGEVENAVADPNAEGTAILADFDTIAGGVYEYFVVGRCEGGDTAESERVRATQIGGAPSSSLLPLDRGGQTLTFDIPAKLPIPAEGSSDDEALRLAREIALRQALRKQDKDNLELLPTAMIPGLERGQMVTPTSEAWEIWGNALHLSTETRAVRWRLEGFGWDLDRGELGELSVRLEPLILEEV